MLSGSIPADHSLEPLDETRGERAGTAAALMGMSALSAVEDYWLLAATLVVMLLATHAGIQVRIRPPLRVFTLLLAIPMAVKPSRNTEPSQLPML